VGRGCRQAAAGALWAHQVLHAAQWAGQVRGFAVAT
jgi:hypothetical protein